MLALAHAHRVVKRRGRLAPLALQRLGRLALQALLLALEGLEIVALRPQLVVELPAHRLALLARRDQFLLVVALRLGGALALLLNRVRQLGRRDLQLRDLDLAVADDRL